jgi:hypothetical protein
MPATVTVLNEVVHPGHTKDNWHLALQLAEFKHSGGQVYKGYRFVCRADESADARHETRIPSLADAEALIRAAKEAGWGNEKG